MKYLILLLLHFITINLMAQDDYVAHLKPINLALPLTYSFLTPDLMATPTAEVRLLNGRLFMGGNYSFEVKKLQNWRKQEIDITKNLVGNNLDERMISTEQYIGFNYFKKFNPNATILYKSIHWKEFKELGNRRTQVTKRTIKTYGPGSFFFMTGCRVGHFSYRSKIGGIMDDNFGVKLPNGDIIYSSRNSQLDSASIYTNYAVNAFFAGLTVHQSTKKEKYHYEEGGSSSSFIYFDVFVPYNVLIDKAYSQNGDEYTIVPRKESKKFENLGYRFGLQNTRNNKTGIYYKIEYGVMPAFTQWFNENRAFVNLSLGLNIIPTNKIITHNQY